MANRSGTTQGSLDAAAGFGPIDNLYQQLAGISNAPSKGEILDIGGNHSTPFSSLREGNLTLDPSIRGLEDLALGNLGTDYGLLQRTLSDRDSLVGNRDQFIRTRTNPLREAIARRKGDLNKELGRTGIRGSFAQQSRTNLATDSGRELIDAESNALKEAIGIEGGYTQLVGQINKGISDRLTSVARDRTARELESLGLSAEAARNVLQAMVGSAGLQDKARQAGGDAFAGIVGTVLGGISDRRLKKNIQKIGEIDDINIYAFDYIWGEGAIGVMSDEVRSIPGAVEQMPSGYDMVHYDKALGITLYDVMTYGSLSNAIFMGL